MDEEKIVYAIVLKWPKGGKLKLGVPILSKSSSIAMLGYSQDLQVQYIIVPKLYYQLFVQFFPHICEQYFLIFYI